MKKILDKTPGLCYNLIRKREGKPLTNQKGTTMEHFEYMDTILTEYQEWLDEQTFKEDMQNDPYGMEGWADERCQRAEEEE